MAGRVDVELVVRGTPAKLVQVLDAAHKSAAVSRLIPPKIPPRWSRFPRISLDDSSAAANKEVGIRLTYWLHQQQTLGSLLNVR